MYKKLVAVGMEKEGDFCYLSFCTIFIHYPFKNIFKNNLYIFRERMMKEMWKNDTVSGLVGEEYVGIVLVFLQLFCISQMISKQKKFKSNKFNL